MKYVLRDVKRFPNLRGPDQKIKWSAIKQNFSHLKDLDLKDTDTGPVRLIIGSNNSDLILPMQIVKPSGKSHADKVPYAVETPLGWAVTNWLPVNKEWHLRTMRLKCMKQVQKKKRSCSGCYCSVGGSRVIRCGEASRTRAFS